MVDRDVRAIVRARKIRRKIGDRWRVRRRFLRIIVGFDEFDDFAKSLRIMRRGFVCGYINKVAVFIRFRERRVDYSFWVYPIK